VAHGVEAAVAHARALWEAGACGLDLGGESTRPGATAVSVDEEAQRVVPAIAAVRAALPEAWLSVDTRRATVAAAALEAGADAVNDVSMGADPAMASVVAAAGATWVLMHARGTPSTMDGLATYDDLVAEVCAELSGAVAAAVGGGVPRTRLHVDVGLGFAKLGRQNTALIHALPAVRAALGLPVWVGASRKRFVGALSGEPDAARRRDGSVGAALAAWSQGADVLRVHDVGSTVRALKVYAACLDG
jgi:dihydropteroate synthase